MILIAIAVIAGVVVYAFTSGMLSGMTSSSSAAQEKISVQSSGFNGGIGPDQITVYVQQTGVPAATVNGMIVKDSSGNTVVTIVAGSGLTATQLTNGVLTTITATIPALTVPIGGTAGELAAGVYTATITTTAGS